MKFANRPSYRLHLELLEDRNMPNNLLGLASGLAPGLANLGIPALDFASLLQESQFPANPIASHGASGNTTSVYPAEVGVLNAGSSWHPMSPSAASGWQGGDNGSAPANNALSADLLGSPSGATANPGILAPQSHPYGKSYGEWSASWWQWAFSLPVDHHPLFDTADCSAGQSGKVWFLGASFAPSVTSGGDVIAFADRQCSVPAGEALFFPVANAEASTVEGNGTTDAELRAAAQSFQDLTTNMSAEVDGRSIANLGQYRVQSPLFTFTLPDNNVLESFGVNAPGGTSSPSVSDGVYLMTTPFSAGQHTIHFHAETPAFHFFLDITYHLNVASG